MNDEVTELLFDAVERLERSIQQRDCPAVVVMAGTRTLILTDYDYQRDEPSAQTFEERAAQQARKINAVRWVFAVPQIWFSTDTGVTVRNVSNKPLGEGEEEVIHWAAFDLNDGIDYGCVPFTRRPDGTPVFGDVEAITAHTQVSPNMPGQRLLALLLAD
jgi:hypothetical protein